MTTDTDYRLSTILDRAKSELLDRWDAEDGDAEHRHSLFLDNGYLHEIADSFVPVYNTEILMVAAENLSEVGLRDIEVGLLGGDVTPIHAAQVAIYEAISEALYEYLDELKDESGEQERLDSEPSEEDIGTDGDRAWTLTQTSGGSWGVAEIIIPADPERNDIYPAIRAYIEKTNFFPDVWWVDDHGGMERITAKVMEG